MTFITDIVSRYVHEAQVSAIKEMAMLSAKAAGAASLAWGLPSFQTPQYIRKGECESRTRQCTGLNQVHDAFVPCRRW